MPMGDIIEFHGMPAIRWRSRDGACAIATLQGAHVVSWTLPDGEECLYLSERSPFEAGRAIRGGVPVVFPQFADRGPLDQHGFARTQPWTFAGTSDTDAGATAAFVLESSPPTLAPWPHAFRLALRIAVGDRRLHIQLSVTNPGPDPFEFTAALHTYLRVSDASALALHGLEGVRYLERGTADVKVEARERVGAREPIDRIYFAAPECTRLEDGARRVRIRQHGFTDTVVWNPGRERTANMADMPPEGFLRMLCVEAAAIDPPVVLAAGDAWLGSQSLSADAPLADAGSPVNR